MNRIRFWMRYCVACQRTIALCIKWRSTSFRAEEKLEKGYLSYFFPSTSINRCLALKHESLETLLEITPGSSVLIPAALWNCMMRPSEGLIHHLKSPTPGKDDSGTTTAVISVHELFSSSLTGVICLQAILHVK